MSKKQEIISIIGAGRMGRALGMLFHKQGYRIASVFDLDIEKARQCQIVCNAEKVADQLGFLATESSMIFIAVPDDALPAVSSDLGKSVVVRAGTVVAHTSGLLESGVLSPVRKKDVSVNSFHPCFSFTENFRGDIKSAFIALEGDKQGFMRLERIARDIGGRPFILSKQDKITYHTACTLASNYLVALMSLVDLLIGRMDCGYDIRLMMPLITGTLKNFEIDGARGALTGPIFRGDRITLIKHLDLIKSTDHNMLSAYISFGRLILKIAADGGLSGEDVDSINIIFNRYEEEQKLA
jgi:predicted short-subunit dehydrogenase-like oxidoreductase (DUF2520 family)